MEIFGIDISSHQRDMDLVQAKNEGAQFAIIRGMYGNGKDVSFELNYQKARNAGLEVGAYQWGRAKNEAQAREEAQLFIEYCLQGKQFNFPVYYDVEDSILMSLSVEELTKLIEAWAGEMEYHGYFVGIYMNQNAFNNEVNGAELAKKYSQWRAYWTSKDKKPICQMWQFGGESNKVRTNIVAGMVCDQDYAYEDFPEIIKGKGFNGYISQSNYETKKSNEEIANEVLANKWGDAHSNPDRRTRLTKAGYDYDAIQAIVNEKLGINKNAVYYTTKRGDNLWNIAKKYLGSGSDYKKIKALNNLSSDTIQPGWNLRIK